MIRPVRLRLSRKAGFDLQALSLATNGLPAVSVTRGPGRKWGNPFDFRKSEHCWTALAFGCRGDAAGRQEACVKAFREWIEPEPGKSTRTKEQELQVGFGGPKGFVGIAPRVTVGVSPSLGEIREALAGKNIACFCRLDAWCHGDVYLDIANRPVCEEVTP